MSNQFEWKTEDDAGWVEEELAEEVAQTAVSSRRSWMLLFITATIVAGLGGGLYWQAQKQVSAASAQVEADIMTSHELVQTAVSNQDKELFHNMLSARDLNWMETQDELMADGLLWSRPFFDAEFLLHDTVEMDAPIVAVSPDLRAAEITFVQPYRIMNDGMRQTVTLTQTAVYRRGSKKWLLSPPDDQFWDGWNSVEGAYLKLNYPMRDEAIALRLAEDLDSLVGEICNSLDGIVCSQPTTFHLRFDTNPASLTTLSNPRAIMENSTPMELPTPTLVGLPVDEAAYRALLRAYGVQVATAVIAEQVEYKCCQHGLIFRAILEKQLYQLGLMAWPPEPIDYDYLLDNSVGGSSLGSLWRRNSLLHVDDGELQQLYALVDYLDQTRLPTVSLAEIQNSLAQHASLTRWAEEIASAEYVGTFLMAWSQHIYAQSSLFSDADPPLPVPEQQLLLSCSSSGDFNRIFHYDLTTNVWSQPVLPSEANDFSSVYPIYGSDQLYVLQNYDFGSSGSSENQMIVYKQDQPIMSITVDLDNNDYAYINSADPNGRFLVVLMFSNQNVTYQLVDLQDCEGLSCATTPLLGTLSWSVDGRYTIFVAEADNPRTQPPVIYLGDERGQPLRQIDSGGQLFWVDETHFGYTRVDAQTEQKREIVVASVDADDDLPQQIVHENELLALIPEDNRPDKLFLTSYLSTFFQYDNQPLLNDNQSLLIGASIKEPNPQQFRTDYYFLLKLQHDSLQIEEIVMLTSPEGDSSLSVSPNGDWVVWHDNNGGTMPSNSRSATLVNMETGESEIFQMSGFSTAWSSDGNWLAYTVDNRLVLSVPGTAYKRYIFHSFSECWNIQWVDGG